MNGANQKDERSKSMNWFLYGNGLRHEELNFSKTKSAIADQSMFTVTCLHM